ncbi:hypothetical protein CURE108131_13045 [Cupriavidus respiraculi]|uniref:Endonuclease n=1 Tax=Cupriavidus respiraculi TaxID=195930 RepID=A0ABN7Z6K1_9BURK|nr:hypothetical protein [Cupriavidus respiraculi]MBY4948403.1 hypothetical protein [Cupriavidus respiraculi]CAG9179986.1 hypothetical protein LMG21510_03955 [Cupriavidus respiraculi]
MTLQSLSKSALVAMVLAGSCITVAQAQTSTAPTTQYSPAGDPAPGGTRDPYTSGARTDRFDPYTQGANQSTRQSLAPTGAESMSGTYGAHGYMGSDDTHYHDLYTLGSRVGRRSQFLDGGN